MINHNLVVSSQALIIKELRKEFVSDQIAKIIFECDCTKEMLIVAEEKAEYRRRRTLNKKTKK